MAGSGYGRIGSQVPCRGLAALELFLSRHADVHVGGAQRFTLQLYLLDVHVFHVLVVAESSPALYH